MRSEIISPALLSFIHGHPHLPLHSWYFVAGVTLSVLNRADEIILVFKHAIEGGGHSTPTVTRPGHGEQLMIARRMREALLKAAPIGGLPKVRKPFMIRRWFVSFTTDAGNADDQ